MGPGDQAPGNQSVGSDESPLDGLGVGTAEGVTGMPGLDGNIGETAVSSSNGSSHEGEHDGEGGRMTLFEHLAELRKRVLICAGAIVLTSIAGYFLYNPVLRFMTEPYRAFVHHHKNMVTGDLVISSPVEGFTTRIKVSLYIGLALAAPVWLWEMWRFITPGLKRNEKRYAVPFVLSALFLFSLGVLTAVLVWPKALNWLISASGSGVAPLFSPSGYVSLYLLVCLVFGAVFLYPIVVMFLMLARIVPSAKWRKWRRPAIVVLCAVAAIVTPSNDPFTFLGMAVPMLLFYEISIIIGRLLKR
ncbi:MAG TPA: twin-arginine translocase subunit TatC [Acidimicrobiales bacterium]|nr:twin-arginine translocase subunit TatC [Acidimicrobiales bacterium]